MPPVRPTRGVLLAGDAQRGLRAGPVEPPPALFDAHVLGRPDISQLLMGASPRSPEVDYVAGQPRSSSGGAVAEQSHQVDP